MRMQFYTSPPLDPRLGRLPEFDNRSRAFPVRSLLTAEGYGRRTWTCGVKLNQGDYPRCVGYAWTHDDAAAPIQRRAGVNDDLAIRWYNLAQDLDQYPGNDYDGSSTLGGAKAGVVLKKFKAYYWCFGLEDLAATVSQLGPVVVGTNWYTYMMNPDHRGFIHVGGQIAGGHEYLIRGVWPEQERFTIHQSWDWHKAYISFSDMERLLNEEGDACYPVR